MSSADSITLNPVTPNEDDGSDRILVKGIKGQIYAASRKPRKGTAMKLANFFSAILTTILVLVFGILGNIFQLLTAPLMAYDRVMVVRWHSYLAGAIWSILQHLYERQSGLTLTISGLEEIPVGENAYVICNHVCFADWALVHAVAVRKKMLSYCKYFVKDSVKYIPIFGWGMKIMGMVMLKRNWAQDKAKFAELFALFTDGKLPVYLVSFPEGSRVTQTKLAKSQAYALENKLPRLNHLLLPRSKGFIATMLGLRDADVHHLYDITAVYYHKRAGINRTWTLWQMFSGRLDDYHVHIHIDRIPFDRMPKGEEELKAWIFTRFKVKDGLFQDIGQAFEEVYQVKQA